jgi:alanine racemase
MENDMTLAEIDRQITTYALIDLDCIAANIRALQAHVGDGVGICAVVKANAYGHGAAQVAQAAINSGAARLAIGRTYEGIELRRAGITAPILNLCYTLPGEADQIVANDLGATVNTVEGAQALSGRASALGKTAVAHLKVDTGMGRYGQLPGEALAFVEQVSRLPNLMWEGIFTHLSTADEADKTYAGAQLRAFGEVLAALEQAGHTFAVRHAANSAATLDLREAHFDMVRTGLSVYGLYPSREVSRDVVLRPALSLISHLARVRWLPAGSPIGYGRTFTTLTDTRVGLVPVGYGDGYYRALSNRAHVLVDGRPARVIGRVCMDQLMVNASGINAATQDAQVVIIGQQGDAGVTVEQIAGWAGTINYEVLTGLSQRIPRVYIRAGRVVEVSYHNGCL